MKLYSPVIHLQFKHERDRGTQKQMRKKKSWNDNITTGNALQRIIKKCLLTDKK